MKNVNKFFDIDFITTAISLYDKLQKEFCVCKRNHSHLSFCPIYFLDVFEFVQQFLFTFDEEIGVDFPIQIADLHNSLENSWQPCQNCSNVAYVV